MSRVGHVESHTDGTPCKEGTRRVPRPFRPCCYIFEAHVSICELKVRYEWWPKAGTWVIALDGAGTEMRFCPHCGAELGPKNKNTDDPFSDEHRAIAKRGGIPARVIEL